MLRVCFARCVYLNRSIFLNGVKLELKKLKALVSIQTPSPAVPKELIILTSDSLLTDLSLCALLPASQKYANHQGAIVNIMASLGLEAL